MFERETADRYQVNAHPSPPLARELLAVAGAMARRPEER